MSLRTFSTSSTGAFVSFATSSKEMGKVTQNGSPDDADAVLNDFQDEFKRLTELDDEWREYFRQSASFRKQTPEDEERRLFFESSITSEETLEDHLQSFISKGGLLFRFSRANLICGPFFNIVIGDFFQ